MPLDALVSLVITFNEGIILERLSGIDDRARRAARLDRRMARGEGARVTATDATATHEQSRARYPDADGYVERDGVRTYWELYGEGDRTLLLLPTWSIVHSRDLEAAGPVLRPPLPRRHVRRARQRALRPPAGTRGVRRDRVRRGCARRDGRDRHRARGPRRAVARRAAVARPRRPSIPSASKGCS